MNDTLRFVLGRTVRLAVLLASVAVLAFVLASASPIDPIDAYVGADMLSVGTEQRELIAERWGLDQPPLERFGSWASQVATGNLGTSTLFNQPVSSVIGSRFLASLALMGTAWVLSGVFGFALGILAAARAGTALDRGIRSVAYALASAPTFWVGLLLLYVFAVALGVAPTCCAGPIGVPPEDVTLVQRLQHLALPAITLSILGTANVVLHTRQEAVEALGSEYVAFARAQGERHWGVVTRHVVRNAAIPAVTLQFASLGELFGGSLFAEVVFNYPGLGSAIAEAATAQDMPLLLGASLFLAVFVYVGNQAADLIQSALDPRVPLLEASR